MKTRIALVTGSNRGIGLGVVEALLEKDFEVFLTSRREKDGLEAMKRFSGSPGCHYHQLDVTDPESIRSMVSHVESRFGRLDILVNNAGIHYDAWQQASNADMKIVRETLETNLLGAWQMCRVVVPLMKRHGYGRIVNVSSGSGAFAGAGTGTPAYSVSKAAMNMLTVKLAGELRGTGILVNSVCPGWVRTDMGGHSAPRSIEKGASGIVWAATLPEGGPTGGFFRDGKAIGF